MIFTDHWFSEALIWLAIGSGVLLLHWLLEPIKTDWSDG